MWMIQTAEDKERLKRQATAEFERMLKDAEKKREAREAWEACKCPHCGRNDPLPPWLM